MAQRLLKQRIGLLERVPLFRHLDRKQLEALAQSASRVHLEAGEQLFRKGEGGRHCFGIVSGRVKVVTSARSGKQVFFGVLDPGEVFGELALLAGGHRTASVSAMEDTELLVVERRDFLHLLHSQPELTVDLLSMLAERLVEVSEVIEDAAFMSLRARLAKKLVALAQESDGDEVDGWSLPAALHQTDLAAMINATRESVNKQLHRWRRAGVVEIDRGSITIRKLDELERLAGVLSI